MNLGFINSSPFYKAVYERAQQRGWAPYQIAGLLGNFHQESRGDSSAMQKGGNGIGAAQWDDRGPALKQFAASRGVDWRDPNLQADFVFRELDTTEKRAAQKLLSSRNLTEAVNAGLAYERPAGFNDPQHWSSHPTLGYSNRLQGARMAMGGMSGPEDPTAPPMPPMAYAMGDRKGPQDAGGNAIQQTFGQPGQPQQGGGALSDFFGISPEVSSELPGFGNSLMNAGAALMAIDNPQGASALISAARGFNRSNDDWSASIHDGQMIRYNRKTGQMDVKPIPGYTREQNLQYKGIDTDGEGKSYDTFVNPSTGEVIRKPTNMQDSAFKKKQELTEETANYWADAVLADPTMLNKVPKDVRPQVMDRMAQQGKEAGLEGKDLLFTNQKNVTDLADYKRRAALIAQMDTFKGEALAAAEQLNRFSKELPREFQQMPLERINQWLATNGASNGELAQKLAAYKAAREGFTRSFNRAMTIGSGGNVSGEERVLRLMPDGASHEQIVGAIQPMVNDVIRMNTYAQWSLENRRAQNGNKPLPHPELADEKAWMEKTFGAPKPAQGDTPAKEAPRQNIIDKLPEGAQQHSDGYFYWQENGKWKRAKAQ